MAEHSQTIPPAFAARAEPAEAPESVHGLFADFLRLAHPRPVDRAPSLKQWVELAEAWRIAHALRVNRGNRSAAARSLGIGRRTLYTKMRKLGIAPTFEAPLAGGDR